MYNVLVGSICAEATVVGVGIEARERCQIGKRTECIRSWISHYGVFLSVRHVRWGSLQRKTQLPVRVEVLYHLVIVCAQRGRGVSRSCKYTQRASLFTFVTANNAHWKLTTEARPLLTRRM